MVLNQLKVKLAVDLPAGVPVTGNLLRCSLLRSHRHRALFTKEPSKE